MSTNQLENRPVSPDIEQQRQRQRNGSTHPDDPLGGPEHLEFNEDDDPPTPRFMQEEGAWKKWKWVPYPVRKYGKAAFKWMKGPQNPKDFKIQPLFPVVQEAPLRLLDRFLPNRKHQILLYMFYIAVWIITFSIVMWRGQVASEIPVYGTPTDISCGTTYWSRNNGCGLDGVNCRPFNGSSFAFRCPANCASYRVLNPRAVGNQEIVYAPLVVGGPPNPTTDDDPIYRGDSFICGAAIHAGVISDSQGGCGVVSLVGTQQNFVSTDRNGIKSIGFDSYFPLSIAFEPSIECKAKDVRWSLLAICVAFSTVLSLFTASSGVFFFTSFISIFWQVGMASDPPSYASIPALFTDILGKFLPAMFCAWVFYDKMGVRRTLKGLTATVEKTVLWLGGCWVGALTNYTFDFIPIQRLTGHDLEQQPGAKAALAIIVIVLFCIVVGQIWCFRQEGRLIRYLKLYALFILGIIICLVLPGLNLRIHHYILALLLLPGTSMQTRPSLLYQGILIGLFVNGIARWGFDPFLQTSVALQGDAQLGSPLPVLLAPVINDTLSTIDFRWEATPGIRWDGISILVNDVERYRAYFGDEGSDHFLWTRDNGSDFNEYFRFGFMSGTTSGDYTKAGTWTEERSWIDPQPGPSRIRVRDVYERDTEPVPNCARRVWK
ncbi:LCCL domain-containing protein [Hypomontagnella monticulosa]|nr:LCCL domain-containing protein [Hypomontagnella monticulosa]